MYSWEVVAIELEDDRENEPDDCRQITKIGYESPTLKTKKIDTAAKMILQNHADWHVEVGGEREPLKALQREDSPNHYCRTLEEDRSDDPLLSLPTIQEYERSKEMEKRF